MVEHGEIGKIINIMCEYPQDWVLMTVASGQSVHGSWRFQPEVIGDSLCVADIGTHLEYLVTAATGLELKEVLCAIQTIPEDLPLETNAQVLLRYTGGVPGIEVCEGLLGEQPARQRLDMPMTGEEWI